MLSPRSTTPRFLPGRLLPVLLAVGVLSVPFLAPPEASLTRAILAGYAISLAMKLRLLVAGRADPGMMASWPRRLLWAVTPQATFWSPAPADRAAIRRGAPGLFLRALLAALGVVAAAGAKARFGLAAAGWPASTALEMVQFFLLLSALGDNAAAIAALAGARCSPLFSNPLAARSPAEFWSRRWNLVVHGFARWEIFSPLARRWNVTFALFCTFAASGLMHEYLVLASVGLAAYRPGWMLAFFAAQGLAVLVTTRLRSARPPVLPTVPAALLHLAWLLVTTPFFLHPLRPLIVAFDGACVALLGALLRL